MSKRVLLIFVSSLACNALHADERGQWLISHMQESVEHLNYEGTFVFMQNGSLDSMRIHHGIQNDKVREHMVALSGLPREVIREDDVVTCIWPQQKLVTVEKNQSVHSIPTIVPEELGLLEGSYRVNTLRKEQIAGHSCEVVSIEPIDRLRYGFKLCIHPETGMLLHSRMFSVNGKLLEEVMFTNIRFLDSSQGLNLEPSVALDDYTWRNIPDEQPVQNTDQQTWYVSKLPPGFSVTRVSRILMSMSDVPVEHVVLTDGMARVSIYIARPRDQKQLMQGLISKGSLNAYSRGENNHQITVMGEVPVSTVEMIGSSFHFSGE